MNISLILNSAFLGVGLAMDAFSVSLSNGLNYKNMKLRKQFFIAGIFALLQAVMPMTGWGIVKKAAEALKAFEMAIPWIAAGLLIFVGIKMIMIGVREEETNKVEKLTLGAMMIQGIATSLDALSVGFTTASYSFFRLWSVCL